MVAPFKSFWYGTAELRDGLENFGRSPVGGDRLLKGIQLTTSWNFGGRATEAL